MSCSKACQSRNGKGTVDWIDSEHRYLVAVVGGKGQSDEGGGDVITARS